MRDILIVIIFGFLILRAFKDPFIGLVAYYWISVMNPHRYTWDFAYSLPFAMVASLVTLISIVIHYKSLKFPSVRELYLFIILWFFITLTTIFSFYPQQAWPEWTLISKIFIMTFVTMLIVNDKKKITYLLIAIVFFIGFVGIKGAIFGLTTGGKYKVWGPPESFIADNNGLGLALVMISPMGFFLKSLFENKWIRWTLLAASFSMIISAILTYSRGALVGLIAMGFFFLLKIKNKFIYITGAALLLVIGITVAPSGWIERMNTITNYEQDDSANMRINSWKMAFNLANDNLLGGGFECFTAEQYFNYAPDPELGILKSGHGSAAHSIYFEVLANHGFLGLFIFLSCITSMLLSLRRINKIGRFYKELDWVSKVSSAIFLSTIAYAVSGAFLSRAFFDLFWTLFAITINLKYVTKMELQKIESLDYEIESEDERAGQTLDVLSTPPTKLSSGNIQPTFNHREV